MRKKTVEEKDRIAEIYNWVNAAIFALVCLIVVFGLLFRVVRVEGASMNPTLKDGEGLMISTAFFEAERGDIVIVRRSSEQPMVKRVIAVGGDTLRIDPVSGKVYLNGRCLQEEYTLGATFPRDFGIDSRVIPDGYLMVMGDNREKSKDSRSAEIGLVPEGQVIGQVLCRIYPLDKAGRV